MLGLFHTRIPKIPFLDKEETTRLHTPSKLEKYENRMKYSLTGERVFQAISIIQKYPLNSGESTQIAREFHKKSKSLLNISNSYGIKDDLKSKRSVRKLSSKTEIPCCNLTRVQCQPHSDNLFDLNFDKRLNYLINQIISQRKKAAIIICTWFDRIRHTLYLKKRIIMNKIKEIRVKSSIIVQKNVRRLLVRHHLSVLRSKYDLIFFYDHREANEKNRKSNNEERNYSHMNNFNLNNNSKTVNNNAKENFSHKEIKIRILKEKSEPDELVLHYTRVLRMYYLPFNKKGVMRKRFKVNFLVNGKIVIDPKYEVDNDEHGNFYNIIESSSFRKKNFRPYVSEFEQPKSKFWENIFEIKSKLIKDNSSVSDISEQSENAIEILMNKHNNYELRKKMHHENFPKKSILRNSIKSSSDKSVSDKSNKNIVKKVSFNEKIEYSC